jgi:hypothetical protein
MIKILYLPFSVVGGFISGKVAQRTFDRLWRVIDAKSPPRPDQRGASWLKLVLALSLQGAIFKLVRGAFDRGSREWFQVLTGRWPGKDQPAPAKAHTG